MLVNKQFSEGETVVLKLNEAKDALGKPKRNLNKNIKKPPISEVFWKFVFLF